MITRNEQSPSTGARASVVRALTCALSLLVAALMSACSRTAAQKADPPPPQVTVATVLERDVTEWDEFTGRLEAVDSVAIRPRVSGYISSVEFTEGALLRRGQLLFQIDARPFEADVDRLKAELARTRATVQRATSELSRAERLRKDNAISLEEHDRRTAFANESEAQVAAVEAALRAAMLNLEFTRVTSPITGRASRAVITEGNLVSSGPGEATLLTTVVSVDPIYASFDADEQIFLRYQELARNGSRKEVRDTKRPIRLALASDEGFPREGQMDFLDNQVDPQTGTIRGRAVFRNPRAELTPGLFVRLRLSGGGRYRGFLIQDRAVGTDLGKKFVYVVGADDTVEYRTVALGPLIDGLRVVKSGVRPGDRIIVNGLQRVRPGAKVAPQLVAMEQVPGSSGAAPAVATTQ